MDSPFIVHPLRADIMGLRSIGPDQKSWINHDLSLNVTATEMELLLRPTQ